MITSELQKKTAAVRRDLEFFNGLGGFDKAGDEYVVILDNRRLTPAPWINVIANPVFGFHVAAEGSGYTWAQNSHENQITPWSNDPVGVPVGEAIYIHDLESNELFSPTAMPIRDDGTYITRHGYGYSRFEHEASGIELNLVQYVPLADPIKISRLTLQNHSGRPRHLSITGYVEWVLGSSRADCGPFVVTEKDKNTGAIFARNYWNTNFSGHVAFADMGGRQTQSSADRTEFLGRNGEHAKPAALIGEAQLSGSFGAGLDPCAALQCQVKLEVGESTEIVFFIGQSASDTKARALINRYRKTNLDMVLDQVKQQWQEILGCVHVKTPDRAMDIMLNGWLQYQTLACRIWARSAFYQASGAYGFRDQLQDSMALILTRPDITRSHILHAAARQFIQGDVQHWWFPQSGQGVRTRISDDRVWLAFVVATYIENTDDIAILDEVVAFIDGPQLDADEHDAYFQPTVADESASLFEHCARGLDLCLENTGELGLPLIGAGDWNDGMNRVGEQGKGESVWLGWLLIKTISLFAPLAHKRGTKHDLKRATRWVAHSKLVTKAIENKAWDGEWYRRATFDDGTWIGSNQSEECRIDSIAQSWAVLSEAADPAHLETAMASLEKHLILPEQGLALLFTPAFDKSTHDPGYIKSYPPGIRENGGQYTHAAIWAVLAFAKLGMADKAVNLFAMLNPINHARTPQELERYKVEPYVVAADVYSVAPHIGRGGWTWYTGAAGWMYRAGIEYILGIQRKGAFLIISPCIPDSWPGFEAHVKVESTHYKILLENSATVSETQMKIVLDGHKITTTNNQIRVALDHGSHILMILL